MKLGMEVYNQFFIIPYKFIKLHTSPHQNGEKMVKRWCMEKSITLRKTNATK